jgi:hypothetical protein
MTLRPASALVAAAALASLAACADSASVTAPTASSFSAGRNVEFNNPRHAFHTRQYFDDDDARTGASRYATSKSSGTGISYHGGTVLQNGTRVVAIYWGSSTYPVGYQNLPAGASTAGGAGDGSLIGTFLRSLGALRDAAAAKLYFNINGTYWGQQGSGVKINPAVSYTGYWNTAGTAGAPTPSASPTDADMVALIQWGLTNGTLAYDANTIYAIFTGTGVNLGGGFGSQYCAYHTHGATTQGNVFYAAMPYNQEYPSGCTSGKASPNADVAANSELNTLAHEIEETTTDDMGNAWYDSRGYENGDKCAWTWGVTKTASNGGVYNQSYNGVYFLIQQNWVNAGSGGCATGY